jgi:tRNA(fMet)-specific endonuclease VapC
MTRYMLDTNVISALVKYNANVTKRVITAPANSLCISAITEGEIYFGLAKRPEAKKLHRVVMEILLRVDVLPWNHEVAQVYGNLRAELENVGKQPGPVDILTAAHALQLGVVFITNDRAFQYVANLDVEDWTV